MINQWMMERWRFPAVMTLAVVAALMALTTEAVARQARPEAASREAGEPIMAIVSIKSQRVTFYDADGWILHAPVSTGTRGRETPAGIFAVLDKEKEHYSSMYDDASMPHMQRITWNGIAMHGGPLPGYAASHGCIRMPYGVAAKLFYKTRIGMRVIISPNDAPPIEISHPALFSPKAEDIATAPGRADTLAHEAVEAAKAFKEARKSAKSMARKVVLQKRLLRKLEWRKKRADAKLERADKALSAAEKAKVRAEERLQKAIAEATELAPQLDTAKSDLKTKVDVAAAATAAANDASQAKEEAKKVEKTAAREVALQKESLRKLVSLKKSADAKLKLADKALSTADKAKAQAEERQQKAAAEATELATQLDTAKSDLNTFAATAAAANNDTQTSHETKKVEGTEAREAALPKASLPELKSLKKSTDAELGLADKALSTADKAKAQAEERQQKAAAEATELATQLDTAKSDLNTFAATAAAANNDTQTSDEAKKVEGTEAREAALPKASLPELKSLKKSADTELGLADKALSTTDQAKAQAEERQQKAAAEATELTTQLDTTKSDLEAKVAATAAANDATQAKGEAKKVEKTAAREAALPKASLRELESLKKSVDAKLNLADKTLSTADKAKAQVEERQRKAAAEATELATQLDTAKSDLEAKVTAAAAATAAVNDATQTSDEAKKVEKTTAREVTLQKASLRKLVSLKKSADAKLKRADKALSAADKAKVRAEERQQKATAEATELATQLDNAKSALKAKVAAAAIAKDAVEAAKIRKAETAKAAFEAKLALEPVSVYISRATQKLYVRRNTHKPAPDGGGVVFDTSIEVPVTIRDPDKPIGTHIFTAMALNDAGLRWTAVTIDDGDDAKDALDRIAIPQDVLDRIAPTALPRSSIIISDEPLSRETNYRTEFVAVLSNQPQGGFITRKPSEDRFKDSGFSIFEFFKFKPTENIERKRRRGSFRFNH